MSQQERLFSPIVSARHCVRCRYTKPVEAFAWRNKRMGRRFAHCRACQAEYHRKHYEANRQRYLDKAAARNKQLRRENQDLLLDLLRKRSCVDCGEDDIVVLEFDHVEKKDFEISQGLRYRSWSVILEEIDKCDVVCANCHRRRTSNRAGSLRVAIAQRIFGIC